jgi:uncharacterized membrane protein YeaQ/YmgE (transglycosylase-associated protein family)
MSFIGWIVLGLISGCTASKVIDNSGEGLFLDVELAMAGAFVGGWLSIVSAWLASAI